VKNRAFFFNSNYVDHAVIHPFNRGIPFQFGVSHLHTFCFHCSSRSR